MKKGFIRSFFALAVLGVCVFSGTNSFASVRPQVYYTGQVIYAGSDSTNDGYGNVCSIEVAGDVGKKISAKIDSIKSTLPFDLVKIDNFQNNDVKSKIEAEGNGYVALVPVVMSDAVKCDTFTFEGKTWYKYDVRTMISLMFCLKDVDGIHIAYNVPLYMYGMLGDNLEHGLNSADPELLKKVQTTYLKEQFKLNAQTAIDSMIIPDSMGKFLTDKKLMKATSQVVDVTISKNSKNIKSKLESRYDLAEIKEISAKVFTSAYLAKHPNTILLPDRLSGDKWKGKVAKHLDPNLSESDFVEETEGTNTIVLDIAAYSENPKVQAWQVVWTIGTGINYTLNGKKHVVGKPSVRTYKVPKDISSNVLLNQEAIFAGAAIQAAQK